MGVNHRLVKAPGDYRDFSLNWASALATSETISASTWSAESGITTGGNSFSASGTTLWLSGGVAGESYQLYNTISTSANRIFTRFVTVKVQELDA